MRSLVARRPDGPLDEKPGTALGDSLVPDDPVLGVTDRLVAVTRPYQDIAA